MGSNSAWGSFSCSSCVSVLSLDDGQSKSSSTPMSANISNSVAR
jgi:hypothetical protein